MRVVSKWSLILLLGLVWACDKEDATEEPGNTEGTLKVNISNLEMLGSTEAYEGWLIVGGQPVSTGTFNVDGNGNLTKDEFSIDQQTLDDATAFVLSIEPVPDSLPAPSSIKLLGGAFQGDMAGVDVSHMAALGDDFSAASGKYILATPTTSTMNDELSGIWFLDLSSGMPAVGLSLPSLAANWIYEGWAVIDGVPVSTGRFSMADQMDDADNFSGSDAPGPPFPGEDFVTNAPMNLIFPTDLSNGAAVISIEPVPDNSPAPFMLKPLVNSIPASAVDHVTYDLTNMSGTSFPVGTVSR